MGDAPPARRMPTRAEQVRVPRRRSRRARVERIGERRRARDPPAHPRAAEIGECRPAAPASRSYADRSDATASRRVAVKSSALGSPQISPITAESAAHLTPSSIAHSASRASRASTWMRSCEASPGGWTRPLSRIAMRSWTHSKGLSVPSCASRKPAQPPSRGCAANSSDRVGLGGTGSCHRSPSPLGSSDCFSAARACAAGDQGKACQPHDSQRSCSTFVLFSRL